MNEAWDGLMHPDLGSPGPPGPPGPPSGPPGSPGPSVEPPETPPPVPYNIVVQPAPPKLDVAKPDKFSGDKRHLLEIFLNQCLTTFIAQPTLYANHRNRITFAASYLSGRANNWWGGYLVDFDSPNPQTEFLHSWEGFRDELVTRFGITDPRAHAMVEIDRIKMADNQRVADFIVEFDQLAKYLDWNDTALADKFFLGLAGRVKEVFASRSTPRPTNLSELAALAASIDNNWWLYKSHKSEGSRSANNSGQNHGNNNNSNNSNNNSNSNTRSNSNNN